MQEKTKRGFLALASSVVSPDRMVLISLEVRGLRGPIKVVPGGGAIFPFGVMRGADQPGGAPSGLCGVGRAQGLAFPWDAWPGCLPHFFTNLCTQA